MKKLLRRIEDLQMQAKEYAATGRSFPTFGINNIVEQLDTLQSKASKLVDKAEASKALTTIFSGGPFDEAQKARKKAKKK